MRDVMAPAYRRSLVHLAWMCLFSSVPVRCKPGLRGRRVPRGCFRPLWAPCPQRAGLAAPNRALGLQHGGAKVLERTFEEWMRYRDECLRRMASEPYPAGTRLCAGRGAG